MLAMALEADATEHDHLVIAFDFLEGLLQNQCGILTIASKKILRRHEQRDREFRSIRVAPDRRPPIE